MSQTNNSYKNNNKANQKNLDQTEPSRVLLVCVINKNQTNLLHDKFYQIFQQFGEVLRILIFERKEINWKLFVEMDSIENAEKAKAALNNTPILDDGSRINVYTAQAKKIEFKSNNIGGVDIEKLKREGTFKGSSNNSLPTISNPNLNTSEQSLINNMHNSNSQLFNSGIPQNLINNNKHNSDPNINSFGFGSQNSQNQLRGQQGENNFFNTGSQDFQILEQGLNNNNSNNNNSNNPWDFNPSQNKQQQQPIPSIPPHVQGLQGIKGFSSQNSQFGVGSNNTSTSNFGPNNLFNNNIPNSNKFTHSLSDNSISNSQGQLAGVNNLNGLNFQQNLFQPQQQNQQQNQSQFYNGSSNNSNNGSQNNLNNQQKTQQLQQRRQMIEQQIQSLQAELNTCSLGDMNQQQESDYNNTMNEMNNLIYKQQNLQQQQIQINNQQCSKYSNNSSQNTSPIGGIQPRQMQNQFGMVDQQNALFNMMPNRNQNQQSGQVMQQQQPQQQQSQQQQPQQQQPQQQQPQQQQPQQQQPKLNMQFNRNNRVNDINSNYSSEQQQHSQQNQTNQQQPHQSPILGGQINFQQQQQQQGQQQIGMPFLNMGQQMNQPLNQPIGNFGTNNTNQNPQVNPNNMQNGQFDPAQFQNLMMQLNMGGQNNQAVMQIQQMFMQCQQSMQQQQQMQQNQKQYQTDKDSTSLGNIAYINQFQTSSNEVNSQQILQQGQQQNAQSQQILQQQQYYYDPIGTNTKTLQNLNTIQTPQVGVIGDRSNSPMTKEKSYGSQHHEVILEQQNSKNSGHDIESENLSGSVPYEEDLNYTEKYGQNGEQDAIVEVQELDNSFDMGLKQKEWKSSDSIKIDDREKNSIDMNQEQIGNSLKNVQSKKQISDTASIGDHFDDQLKETQKVISKQTNSDNLLSSNHNIMITNPRLNYKSMTHQQNGIASKQDILSYINSDNEMLQEFNSQVTFASKKDFIQAPNNNPSLNLQSLRLITDSGDQGNALNQIQEDNNEEKSETKFQYITLNCIQEQKEQQEPKKDSIQEIDSKNVDFGFLDEDTIVKYYRKQFFQQPQKQEDKSIHSISIDDSQNEKNIKLQNQFTYQAQESQQAIYEQTPHFPPIANLSIISSNSSQKNVQQLSPKFKVHEQKNRKLKVSSNSDPFIPSQTFVPHNQKFDLPNYSQQQVKQTLTDVNNINFSSDMITSMNLLQHQEDDTEGKNGNHSTGQMSSGQEIDLGAYINPQYIKASRKSRVIYARWFDRRYVTMNMLQNMFGLMGNIKKMIYLKEKSSCLIQYCDQKEASKAKDDFSDLFFFGQQLKSLEVPNNDEEYFINIDAVVSNLQQNQVILTDTLKISNIEKDNCVLELLQKHFNPFGNNITSIKYIAQEQEINTGIIRFSDKQIALMAFVTYQNSFLNGRIINLSFSRQKF